MYDIYAHIARLNAEALRRCEKEFLDPEYDRNTENEDDDTC